MRISAPRAPAPPLAVRRFNGSYAIPAVEPPDGMEGEDGGEGGN